MDRLTAVGRLAQLVERFLYTEDVGGSSPSSPTTSDETGMADQDEEARQSWARMTAHHLVDGALAASERSPGPHPSADQVTLLREIARRALWHMPNSAEEVRNLVRYVTMENLRQPNPLDDDPPGG